MDIFIAYQGNPTYGTEKDAEKIYSLLNGLECEDGSHLEVYFHPKTGNGISFGMTPGIASDSSVFLLVANESIERDRNGKILDMLNDSKRRLFEEIQAFAESKNYRTSKVARARVITSGSLSLNEAELLHYSFGGTEHFRFDDILRNPDRFLKILSLLIGKGIKIKQDGEERLPIRRGCTTTFGHWPKDNGEPIRWKCYSDTPGKALLIAEEAIDCTYYKKELSECTYETSDIRAWLNGYFFENAFDGDEKAMIIPTVYQCEDNPKYGTKGGKEVCDKVTIPSLNDVYYHLKMAGDERKTAGDYAKKRGVFLNPDRVHATYWLRNPGYHSSGACVVDSYGYVSRSGNGVNDNTNGVVPMLWIDLPD